MKEWISGLNFQTGVDLIITEVCLFGLIVALRVA